MSQKIIFKYGKKTSLPTVKESGQVLFAIDESNNTGTIYFDTNNKRFQMGVDGGPYVPLAGGTMTGPLSTTQLTVNRSDNDYPTINFIPKSRNPLNSSFIQTGTNGTFGFYSYHSDQDTDDDAGRYYTGYTLPGPTAGLNAENVTNGKGITYEILTAKKAVTVAQGGTGQDMSTAPANALVRMSSAGTFWYTASANGAVYATSANGAITFGTLPVAQGGTGKTTFTSGQALIGNGTGAITTRAITNNTAKGPLISSTTWTNSTNLVTLNTLAYWDGAHAGDFSNLSKLGTITKGVWNASTIAVEYGGTGSTTKNGACENLGAVKKSGDTMTGCLWANGGFAVKGDHDICILSNTAHGYFLKDLTGSVVVGGMRIDPSTNKICFSQKMVKQNAYERYYLPAPASLTSDKDYTILTTKSAVTVAQGGTGATTFVSGQALIGNGTGAITTRAITDNTAVGALISSSSWTSNNSNLVTLNTLAFWNGAHAGNHSNLSKLATVTSGTWQATKIGIAYGGTNAANADDARKNLAAFGLISKITSTADDTVANWCAKLNGYAFYSTAGQITSQPNQWGFLLNYVSGSTEAFQIWRTQPGGATYWRSGNGNGWATSWTKVYDELNKPTASELGVLPLAGGTMTGTITLAATGLKTSHGAGFTTNQYGNFVHQGTSTTDIWCICNNAGTNKFSVQYETGAMTAQGTITAPTARFTSGTDAAEGSNAAVALRLGSDTGLHIDIDNNEILAKSDATTMSTLHLNGASITSGAVLTAKGASINGQITSSYSSFHGLKLIANADNANKEASIGFFQGSTETWTLGVATGSANTTDFGLYGSGTGLAFKIGQAANSSIISYRYIDGKASSQNWIQTSRRGAFRVETAATGSAASAALSMKVNGGSWAIANLATSSSLYFVFGSDANYSAGTNSSKTYYIDTEGIYSGYIDWSHVKNPLVNVAQGGTGATNMLGAQANLLTTDSSKITATTNLNTILQTGRFKMEGNASKTYNWPADANGARCLIIQEGALNNNTYGYWKQTAHMLGQNRTYSRNYHWDHWMEWKMDYNEETLVYSTSQPTNGYLGRIWLKPIS